MSTYVDISQPLSNDETVSLPISIPVGTYNALLSVQGRDYFETVTAGAIGLTINNRFRANAVHSLKIYDSSGMLYMDTIYQIQTPLVLNTSSEHVSEWSLTTEDGQTEITDTRIVGASNIIISLERDIEENFTYDYQLGKIIFGYKLSGGQQMKIRVFK